jgi:erythromycin esterase
VRTLSVLLLSFLVACSADRKLPAPVVAPSPAPLPVPDDAWVGTVEAPDGSAASGAVVALNRIAPNLPSDEQRIALVRTDAQGRFRLPRPREPFAITVTSPRGSAVVVTPIDPSRTPSLPGTSSTLRLGPISSGAVLAGTLRYVGGVLPAGTLVAASRVSKDEGDIFYGEISGDGTFTLPLPAGTYGVHIATEDGIISRPARVSGGAGARMEVALDASPRAPAPDEVVAWVKERAIPISAELGTDDQDLAPLVAAFGDARMIGVGEATHGTLEFSVIKDRLFRRMVATHGVTVLAMEANFADAELVDAYLQTGRGTPDEAVKHLFRVWQTEEVRDLIAWMRTWNADPKHRRKIHFRGYDVQGARESMAAVRTYLKRVDPPAESLLGALAALDAKTNTRGMVELTDAQKAETSAAAAGLVDHFAAHQRAYIARSDAAGYALAAQHARAIQQAQARFAGPTFKEQFAARDRAMGDNAVWLLEQAGPDARMMVWAHNGHVQLDASALPAANMGMRLRERLGAQYLSVGFVMNKGAYRASPDPKTPKTSVEVPLAPVEPGYIAEAFARIDVPTFAIDLRTAPGGLVSGWLAAPHLLHSCGWIVREDERTGYPDSLAHLFDMAIYVGQSSPSRPLQR